MVVSNFMMLVLAVLALIAAFLVLRVAVNMGHKISATKALLGEDALTPGKKKPVSGSARNFAPSQF